MIREQLRITVALSAILFLTPPVLAQDGGSSVVLSGQVGAGTTLLNHQGASGASTKSLTDNLLNISLLKITGTDDLGGGMRALFQLETGLALDTGSAGGNGAGGQKFWNRQSWVGVDLADLGRLTLGRQFHAATERVVRSFDVYNVAGSSLQVAPLALFGVNRFANNDSRADNSVRYRVAVPGVLEFSASVAAGEGTGGRSYSVDLSRVTSGYTVGVVYTHYDAPTAIAGSGDVPAMGFWAVGGNAPLGPDVDVYASWLHNSLDSTVAGRPAQKNRVLDVGVAYRVAPLITLKTAYYDDRGRDLDGVSGRDGRKQTLVVSGLYALSKRTELYMTVFGNRFSDGYVLDPVNVAALGRQPGSSSVSGTSAGLRHRF